MEKMYDLKKNMNKNVIGFGASVLSALIVILISMKVWEIDINVPVATSGDRVLILAIFKSIFDYGIKGLYFCQSLGAPEVSALLDIPFVDTDLAFEVLLLSKFLPNVNAVYYIAYFLTYPLAAATMYLLMHKFTENTVIKVFVSIVFAITPYHFSRGMSHLTLSHYYVVPIAIYLMLLIYEDEFTGIVPTRYLKYRWKIALMYAGCVILGLGNVYYAFFGLLCMAVGLLSKIIKEKKASAFIKEAAPLYAVLLSVFAGLMPKIIYSVLHGKNKIAGVRSPQESEIYALKIIQMLLPNRDNRISFLSRINKYYTDRAFNVNENSAAALGVVAVVGFLIACSWIIYKIVNYKCKNVTKSLEKLNILSFAILVDILYSVTGGFGSFVSYFIIPQIRCLNRSSIVIVCMSLGIIALELDRLGRNLKRHRQKVIGCCILGGILIFLLYSEVNYSAPGWQEVQKKQDVILKDFFSKVENSLDEDAMVYELPYMKFPEVSSINQMKNYEPACAYLYTDAVHWSYGGVKGRNTSAETLYTDDGMSKYFVNNILNAGFEGVYIDTKGYADGGTEIISFYSDVLGLRPIISADGWLYFFKLEDIEASKEELMPGYYFIKKFTNEISVEITMEETSTLLEQICEKDQEAYDIIYSWLEQVGLTTDLSFDDYIKWSYNNILLREPNDNEIKYWRDRISNGTNKKDAMIEFFTCGEFRKRYFNE